MRTIALFPLLAIVVTSSTISVAKPVAYALPDESARFKQVPGVEAAEAHCATCHSADYINTQPPRKGAAFWNAEVHKMIKVYGAPIEETDTKAIVDYLSGTY